MEDFLYWCLGAIILNFEEEDKIQEITHQVLMLGQELAD
jgi:hypothetical protein